MLMHQILQNRYEKNPIHVLKQIATRMLTRTKHNYCEYIRQMPGDPRFKHKPKKKLNKSKQKHFLSIFHVCV